MITREDLRMVFVRGDLRYIDQRARSMEEDPVIIAVSKAITIAQLHPDVESRVTCKDMDEAEKVIGLLAKIAGPEDRVSDTDCALELANGSCVKVIVKGAPKS